MSETPTVTRLDDVRSSEAYYRACRPLGQAVWLDSGDAPGGRFDIITAEPVETLQTRGGVTEWRDRDGVQRRVAGDPFRLLGDRVGARSVRGGFWPFAGGAIGYFGYELGYPVVHLPTPPPGDLPDMLIGIHDWAILREQGGGAAWLLTLDGSRMSTDRLADCLSRTAPISGYRLGSIHADRDDTAYARHFARVMRYIRDGDCYQVNLSRCYSAAFAGDPLAAYLALRASSPAPFGAYLETADQAVLSVSPERFLSLRNGHVETRPIKGTRPRDSEPRRDAALAEALRRSEKDQAENLMIVDLLRNDLGRVCSIGSIAVPELFRIESHPTVHHLVSTVTGRLRDDLDAADLVRACFPGGSITGAPKRRAMEIIAELEGARRGVYCGAIGYLGHDGSMDTSIAIRTAVVANGSIHYRAGGGLVSDSDPREEFLETEHKARAFLGLASG